MKSNLRFILAIFCCLLSGCALIKEVGKGFAGISTQVLEDGRKDALKKSFALSYNDCYAKVKDILAKDTLVKSTLAKDRSTEGAGLPYIYSEDHKKKMIAIYFSEADTTPVGIFFTEEPGVNTMVEVSSPSIYAKEEIAKRIFTGIDALVKPKVSLEAGSLVTASQEEKKADVEKKVNH